MKAEATAYGVSGPSNGAGYPEYRGNLPVHTTADVDEYNGKVTRRGPLRLKGYRHIFDSYTSIRWNFPHLYRKPGFGYEHLSNHRHSDVFNREYTGGYDDRYLSPYDGKIKRLVVQATDDVYDNTKNGTWRRTFIRNISPFYLRLANWPLNHVDYTRKGGPTSEDWPMICVKWFIASIAITFVIGTPTPAEGKVRNNGRYDVFPYKYNGYPKVCRNLLESDTSIARRVGEETNPIAERILRPRYLCFLREPGKPAMIMNVEEWITQYKSERTLAYVFVAYTAEQFSTTEDLRELHQIADAAARNAGVPAYWVGCSCMPEPENLQEDVYRIGDVIRGAHSMIIAVARPVNDTMGAFTTIDEMLQQWGKRVWTFPEVLLSPAGKDIKVYARGTDLMSPLLLAKNQFAARVWRSDALIARQLIDHYEGNLILNRLELVTLALECLQKRETTQYFRGDHSYALMGLLRIRPKVDRTDSAFQAFARLSLANDSDQLLERLICVLPKHPNQPWYSMDDAYGAKLWDILPQTCSIAGIGHDDTIILDGCHAANVRWKSFAPVAYNRIDSWKRFFAKKFLHTGGYVFYIAWVLILLQFTAPIGVMLLVYSLILMGLSPYMLRVLYLGKFWGTQAWFFGFEGYMDIETIERQIFGSRLRRMQWTAFGSPLSRHHKNEYGEYVADDPTCDPETRALIERAKRSAPGEQKIFTIVDTNTMTVTLFAAARPPVAFILAGSEGGMQRAIGCSYDWATATLYRETVLRLETPVIDKMNRIPRVKIGFKRPLHPVRQGGAESTGRYVV